MVFVRNFAILLRKAYLLMIRFGPFIRAGENTRVARFCMYCLVPEDFCVLFCSRYRNKTGPQQMHLANTHIWTSRRHFAHASHKMRIVNPLRVTLDNKDFIAPPKVVYRTTHTIIIFVHTSSSLSTHFVFVHLFYVLIAIFWKTKTNIVRAWPALKRDENK